MFAVTKIVVGVEMPETRPWDSANLDACSRLAVRQAFRLAQASGATVHLVTVLPKPYAGFFRSEDDAESQAEVDQAEARKLLDSVQDDYAALNVGATNAVAFGRPWLELLKATGGDPKTLIACGTQQRNAVSRLLFGSTGLKLLRNAPGPVWLVKPRIDNDAIFDVLAATDLSDVGEVVIATGVALGHALPVKLTVMNVVDADFDRRMAHAGASDGEIAEYRRKAKEAAEAKLHEQLAMTDYRSLENGVRTQMAEGVPDAALLSAIQELDIDLLIMATSARGGIPGMIFGNTAERLMSSVPCSLLAIKPDDFRCPIDLA